MSKDIPRVRMFAGPNGSGKSSFKSMLPLELLGIYINPDEIEQEICDRGFLDLEAYQVTTTKEEIFKFFAQSSLLEKADCLESAHLLRFNDNKLSSHEVIVNAYFASVAAGFIRQKSMDCSKSFTFETVMSFPDKVDLLRIARNENRSNACMVRKIFLEQMQYKRQLQSINFLTGIRIRAHQ